MDRTRYALDIGTKITEFLENYYQVNCRTDLLISGKKFILLELLHRWTIHYLSKI